MEQIKLARSEKISLKSNVREFGTIINEITAKAEFKLNHLRHLVIFSDTQ